MDEHEKVKEKTQKTALLLSAANLIVTPLLFLDKRMAYTTWIIMNSLLLHHLHKLGKSRRPGSNALNSLRSFFAGQINGSAYEVENTFRNIINGGAALYDDLISFIDQLGCSNTSHH